MLDEISGLWRRDGPSSEQNISISMTCVRGGSLLGCNDFVIELASAIRRERNYDGQRRPVQESQRKDHGLYTD